MRRFLAVLLALGMAVGTLTAPAAGAAPKPTYVYLDLQSDMTVRSASADPSWSVDTLYGWDVPQHEARTGECCSGFSAELDGLGRTAWMTIGLRGTCRSGKVWLQNVNLGTVTFSASVDGKKRFSKAVGPGTTVGVTLKDLTKKHGLRISAAGSNMEDGDSTTAWLTGYVSCQKSRG